MGWKENDSEQSCTRISDTCSGFIEVHEKKYAHADINQTSETGVFVRRNFSSIYKSLLFADCFASRKMTIWCCLQTVLFIFNERVWGSHINRPILCRSTKQLRIRAQRCSNLIKARGYILGSLSYLVIICIVFALFLNNTWLHHFFEGFVVFVGYIFLLLT